MRKHVIGLIVLAASMVTGETSRAQDNQDAGLHSQFQLPKGVTPGIVSGKIENGVIGLNKIFGFVQQYRGENGGIYPRQVSELIDFIFSNNKVAGGVNGRSQIDFLFNDDNKFTYLSRPEDAKSTVSYLMGWRPDGSPIGGQKPKGTVDVVAYTNIYFYRNSYRSKSGKYFNNPFGYYLSVYEDGIVRKTPYDLMVNFPIRKGFSLAFPNQPFLPVDSFTYAEYWENIIGAFPPIGKKLMSNSDEPVEDNGGPESLTQFSRRVSPFNEYGINREDLWIAFNASQTQFSLTDIQIGAKKLGFDMEAKRLSLAQLRAIRSPALLFLKDDARIVMLATLDDDRAVVIDRGVTRNVARDVLEKRYSGEALLPTKALTQNAGIVADDAVRALQLRSLEAEVSQQFMLRNTGKVPLTLQLEYPLLGVTESKLSQDTLAPGGTATLDLKVKWRSILKAPTQNVLVSLQTSDPIVPRLQLAILLTPPQAAAK